MVIQQHERNADLWSREQERIIPLLRQLASCTTPEQVRKTGEPIKFLHPELSKTWQKAFAATLDNQLKRAAQRRQRMQEFGMLDIPDDSYTRGRYLDELLAIEAEVMPFLPFVRRAFRAALPTGESVSFDPYRHTSDGIEFDAETIRDPHKWYRGEVMRTLKRKRSFVPIEQINAFCLDYSKSMTHEPMRNLFKTVFLLVLGLEGRRTYDAVHFFGSRFDEVVDFSTQHTSRSVIYRILRHVGRVQGAGVRYGGTGYTNISAGLEKSWERVNGFEQSVRIVDPEVRTAKSIFVLSDGEPTGGIFHTDKLHDFIEEKRQGGEVAIKGIYLHNDQDAGEKLRAIFGEEHCVTATTFGQLIAGFVSSMTRTYTAQRRAFRAEKKRP